MPAARSQVYFLARGSALLVALLALWWFLFLSPLRFLLRESVQIFGSLVFGVSSSEIVTESQSGSWTFRIPVEAVIPNSPEHPGPTRIHSIDFDVAYSDLNAFTFSLPVYWAIMLAAPGLRHNIRPLIWGTILMAMLEIVLLLVFVEISARNVVGQLAQSLDGWTKWWLHFGDYLVVNVIPYAAPFLIAIPLHPELRRQIFQWESEAARHAAEISPARSKNRGRSIAAASGRRR